MAKRTIKANELKGLFIYQNTKQGTVWYDIFTKKGYIISSQDTAAYEFSSYVFPACVVLAYFMNNLFNLSIGVCVAIGVVAYLIFTILYRIFFFYKLPVAKGFVKPQEGFMDTIVSKYSKVRLILLEILFGLVVIICQIGKVVENMEGSYALSMNIMTVLASIGMVVIAIAIRKKIDTEKL